MHPATPLADSSTPSPIASVRTAMRVPILVALSDRETTIAPGVFLRRRSPYVWIRFRDHRGRKQRESTGLKYNRTPDGSAARVTPDLIRKAQRKLDHRRGQVSVRSYTGPDERRVRFADLMQLIREDYGLRRYKSSASLESRIRCLTGFFGNIRAIDLTPALVVAYQHARKRGAVIPTRRPRKDGKRGIRRPQPAANATVNRDLEILKRAYRLARLNGLIAHVPEFPDDFSEKDNVRRGFTTHKTYLAIRRLLSEDYADVLDFGYLTGWRKSLIHGLRWPAVHRDDNAIEVPAELNKPGEPQRLWMFPELRAVIDRRWARRSPHSGLVFHVNGKRMGDWTARWKSACLAAEASGLRFHDLRRTASRNLVRAGVDRKVARKVTGHLTDAMFDRYDILDDEDLKEAMPKYSEFLRHLDILPDPRTNCAANPRSLSAATSRPRSKN
jgi:integrase